MFLFKLDLDVEERKDQFSQLLWQAIGIDANKIEKLPNIEGNGVSITLS